VKSRQIGFGGVGFDLQRLGDGPSPEALFAEMLEQADIATFRRDRCKLTGDSLARFGAGLVEFLMLACRESLEGVQRGEFGSGNRGAGQYGVLRNRPFAFERVALVFDTAKLGVKLLELRFFNLRLRAAPLQNTIERKGEPLHPACCASVTSCASV
jgi:hypothetical protein